MSGGISDQHGQPHNNITMLTWRNSMRGLIEQLKRIYILDDIPEVIDFGGLKAARHSFTIGPAAVVLAFAIAAGVSIYFDPAIHQTPPQSTHVDQDRRLSSSGPTTCTPK